MSSKVSVEDVDGLLGRGFSGSRLDFVGQGLHPRLQLYLHLSLSLSLSLSTPPSLSSQLLKTPSFQIKELGLETEGQKLRFKRCAVAIF